jgi:hypothetical protein
MNKHSLSPEQLAREKALYLYISAFEQGDFERMDPILQQAVLDPILDRMITEAHDYFLVEDKIEVHAEERERVRALIFEHLGSGIGDTNEDMAIPPLTVDDVIGKLQWDPKTNAQIKQEALKLQGQLRQRKIALPQKLSLKEVYRLFEQLGLSASTRLQKLFQEKAVLLAMGREKGMAQMAATRHQRGLYEQKKTQLSEEKQLLEDEEEQS